MPAEATEAEKLLSFLNDPNNRIVAKLFTDAIPADMDGKLLSEFHEPTFPGYAPVRLTDFRISDGSVADLAEAVSEAANFTAAAIVDSQLVTMIALTKQVGDGEVGMMLILPLERPYRFSIPGHTLTRIFRVVSHREI